MRSFELAILGISLMSQGAAQTAGPRLTTIYSFTDTYGDSPTGVIERDGVLYGAITAPGAALFRLTPPSSPGGAWTERVLYSFTGSYGPYLPRGRVVMANDGAIYGATLYGGSGTCAPYGCGTAFQVSPPPSSGGTWTGTMLHNFTGDYVICDPICPPPDGQYPEGGLTAGPGGVYYGTTQSAGPSPAGAGMVFELTPPASPGGSWTETVLYSFTAMNGDGAFPQAGLVMDKNGSLYGTTVAGGGSSQCGAGGCGTVFRLTPPATKGGAWTEAVLYAFNGGPGDGSAPDADLTFGKNGVLYGTTYSGGSGTCPARPSALAGCGTVFQLTPPRSAGGTWTETVLYSFRGGALGKNPDAGVTMGKNGELYGTTYYGGGSAACKSGCGTLFRLTPPAAAGGTWRQTVLHKFTGADGAYPAADLLRGANGAFYGTTLQGGPANAGTVFELIP